MTETPALGDSIRESRLALGYSLGQLATKVGRTAAIVRTWERGEGVPNEESRAALESVLDIEPGTLEGLLPPHAPEAEDAQDDISLESEEEPSADDEDEVDVDGAGEAEDVGPADSDEESDDEAIDPSADTPEAPEDEVGDGDDEDLEGDEGGAVAGGLAAVAVAADDVAASEDDEAADEDEVAGGLDEEAERDSAESDGSDGADAELPEVPLVDDGITLDEDETSADEPGDGDGDDDQTDDTLEGVAAVTPFEVDPELIDEPTEAVVVPVVAAATGVATQTRSVVTVSEPKEKGSRNPLRAFFDPNKRWLYWLRALLTIAVAVVLLFVVVWAAGELFDALGEVLDSIEPTEVDDGEIDALGRFRTLI